jgi:hypothetical protein
MSRAGLQGMLRRLDERRHRTDMNAMASTAIQPTMTSDATAPAMIFAFSFHV